jgi:hypothetical protein
VLLLGKSARVLPGRIEHPARLQSRGVSEGMLRRTRGRVRCLWTADSAVDHEQDSATRPARQVVMLMINEKDRARRW